MSKIPGFLKWRYDLYLSEYVDLYGSISFYFKMTWNNRRYSKYSKIAYIFANKRNVGDYISHRGLREGIDLPGPWLLCSPYWEKQLNKNIKELREHSPDCILVIGGGGLLQPVFENFWQTILDSQLRFAVVGVGINQLNERHELDHALMKKLVLKSILFSVRDSYTQQTLEFLTGKCINLTVCPSVAYLQQYVIPTSNRSNSLVHMIHPTDMRLAKIDKERLCRAIAHASNILGLKYEESTNMTPNHTTSIEQIAAASVVVSTRLHGCIMSYALSTPYLSIACDKKISYFNQTHTRNKTIEASELYDVDAVVARINEILNATGSVDLVVTSLTKLETVFADLRQLVNDTK